MIVTVKVTKADIVHGQSRHSAFCPISIAVRRTLIELGADFDRLGTYSQSVRILDHAGHVHKVDLPPVAQSFVTTFDNHDDGDPLQFVLDFPNELFVFPSHPEEAGDLL